MSESPVLSSRVRLPDSSFTMLTDNTDRELAGEKPATKEPEAPHSFPRIPGTSSSRGLPGMFMVIRDGNMNVNYYYLLVTSHGLDRTCVQRGEEEEEVELEGEGAPR